jgi:transposase
VPGGIRREISAGKAAAILEQVSPAGPAAVARCELAAEFLTDLRRLDAQLREASKKLSAAVRASGTSLIGLFGVGPVIAGTVIGDVRQVFRFPDRDHFASWNGTAPVEVSSGDRTKACRLSLRGNRRVNHAIHMAAISQIRHQRSDGRAFYEKKVAEGKTHKEALRSLKRRISDAIYAALVADARRAAAATCPKGPGGQPGNHSASRAAGSHPEHQHFGQATPGPRNHTTATAAIRGRAGHSSIAAVLPPATPQVQVERPQPSQDERPGGAARRRPYPATRKAPMNPPTRL